MKKYVVAIPERHTFTVIVAADSPAEAQQYAAGGHYIDTVALDFEGTVGSPADWPVEEYVEDA